LGLFLEDLELNCEMRGIGNDYFGYAIKNKRLYIDTYHPAQRTGITGISQQQYCDDIIRVAKIWSINY